MAIHFNHSDQTTLQREVQQDLKGQPTFHWPLEFPEVMVGRGGFDAFVGNPPFMGGSKITGFLSTEYREFIVDQLTHGDKGKVDLSAYFFLRGVQLLDCTGVAGMLSTNSISQGDNRKVCLQGLIKRGKTIIRAYANLQWPGDAGVTIAALWVANGRWHGGGHLDAVPVPGITSYLTPPDEAAEQPSRLPGNIGRAFRGTEIKGNGFILTPTEARLLIERHHRNQDVIVPYLTGEDINSRSNPSPSRFVINFREWDKAKAAQYEECFAVVTEKVKPFRDTITKQIHEADYWKLWDKRLESYARISALQRILVRSERGNMHSIAFVENVGVFANTVIVIGLSTFEAFACLQSSIHEEWCRRFGGAALRTDMSYSAKSCFETFPFPVGVVHTDESNDIGRLTESGKRFYHLRQEVLLKKEDGLTQLYNRFHDP